MIQPLYTTSLAIDCECLPPKVGRALEGKLSIVLTDTGLPYDPPTVYAWSYFVTTKVSTSLSVTRVSAGLYTAVFAPMTAGPWILRFADSSSPPTGSAIVEEKRITVRPLDY